jgi:hypothetical protein
VVTTRSLDAMSLRHASALIPHNARTTEQIISANSIDRKMAGREAKLKPTDRSMVSLVVAGLRRVVVGKYDRHRALAGVAPK